MPRLIALLLIALSLAACGAEERVDEVADDARRELREQRDRLQEEVRRLRDRVEELIGRLEQAVPRARETSPQVEARGRSMDGFLTGVLKSVDAYWTETFAANGLPEPRVAYAWVEPGRPRLTGCGALADDRAAFYCPGDDTIYIAQRFAAAVYEGAIRGLPGEGSGGRAAGDFGVAYIVAHEYAHNLQHELDLFTLARSNSSKPFELQADCLAGAWGSSVFAEGRLKPGDIEEAVGTALAVGDFDVSSANHHGTPEERRAAWLDGFDSADPSVCTRYVPTT